MPSAAPPPVPAAVTASAASSTLTVARTLGRGVGQIFFQPHALTGLLIVAGVAVHSPPMAAQVAVGTIVSTEAAHLMGQDADQGLQGYNGALVGAAAWASTGATADGLRAATLATLIGAAACPAIQAALARALGRFDLPVLTAPFCVASGIIAMLVGSLTGASAPIEAPVSGPTAWLVVRAVLTGVSQVVLVESWPAGVLILAGLFVAGWRVGASALLGSAVGTAMTAASTSLGLAVHGLGGYAPCLTAIALAAVFVPRGATAWLLAVIGSVLSVFVGWGFASVPVPAYTWPFVVATWAMLLVVALLRRHHGDGAASSSRSPRPR